MLAKISTIIKIFDLPEPIMMLIDKLGLDNIRDKDDDFADVINELFDGDEILKDNQELQEGTLVNFAKKKFVDNEDDKLEQRNVKLHFKKEDEELAALAQWKWMVAGGVVVVAWVVSNIKLEYLAKLFN